jgi:class 3 adenylate cyclase
LDLQRMVQKRPVRVERRLAAIVAADVAGYSRLMGLDEVGTFIGLTERRAILDKLIRDHGGRIANTAGDSVLAEFGSAVDAVECAVEAQAALAEANSNLAPDHSISFRIGVHIGDVMVRAGDLSGDGVNIAARLESIATPGGISISEDTYRQVRDKVDAEFIDCGEQTLKNLGRPLRIFAIELTTALNRNAAGVTNENQKGAAPHRDTVNFLPLELTSFVGRQKEIADIKSFITTTRLLTLSGPGGAGKTRLATRAVSELLNDFPDGIFFVELAALSDPQLVPQAVASAIGITEQQGRPLIEKLISDLSSKRIFIVIDNCEHLVAACADFAEKLLRGSSMLRLIATSREILGIQGEVNYRVPPLSMPAITAIVSPKSLLDYEATRLFVERATSSQPEFKLTEHSAQPIADVCAHLDGLPLAIELAAARVDVLSVEQIRSRLSDRFHLLGRRNRAHAGRHQTLQAVID